MKKCGIKNEMLVDYIYGETVTGGGRASLEAHINGCPECRAELEKLKAIMEAAASIKVDFSGDIWNMQRSAIMKKLKRKEKSGANAFEFFRGRLPSGAVLAAALILMVAGAGITYFYHTRSMEQQRTLAENAAKS